MLRRSTIITVLAATAALLASGVLLLGSPGSAVAAGPTPDLDLPFTCGQQWRLDSWGHAPALDMVREPDQTGTEGAALLAPADGTVEFSYRHDNAGNVIQIDHGGGWFTTYLHLQSRAVAEGDRVSRGDAIGQVGRSGPTANNHPHLHFELALDADGSGRATWGSSNSERVRPVFDGVTYGQGNGQTWRRVTSTNCPEAPPQPTTTAPPATPSTAPSTVPSTAPTTAPPDPAPSSTAPLPLPVGVASCHPDGASQADAEVAASLVPELTGRLAERLDAYRISCARRIVETALAQGFDRHAAVAAVAAAITDSDLQNHEVATGETSLGLFQQRSFWGTPENRLNPEWATKAFLAKMVRKYPDGTWREARPEAIAQTVQVSAHPDRYGHEVADAALIVDAVMPASG